MSNERYLIVSYFFVGGLSIVIAMAAYAFLRHPLDGLARGFANRNLAAILKRLFPAGLVLPALAGFLSVSYRGCQENYASIIADRSYLVAKNQQQLSAICLFLMLAVLSLGIIVLLSLLTQPKDAGRSGDRDPSRRSL